MAFKSRLDNKEKQYQSFVLHLKRSNVMQSSQTWNAGLTNQSKRSFSRQRKNLRCNIQPYYSVHMWLVSCHKHVPKSALLPCISQAVNCHGQFWQIYFQVLRQILALVNGIMHVIMYKRKQCHICRPHRSYLFYALFLIDSSVVMLSVNFKNVSKVNRTCVIWLIGKVLIYC